MTSALAFHYLKELHLSGAAQALPGLLREAETRQLTHLDFLIALLKQETDRREELTVARRIKQAGFPQQWPDIFVDTRMTKALIDRLTHRADIHLMNGESYRFRQAIQQLKASPAAES